MKKAILKIIGISIGIVILNTIVFSDLFLGISLFDNLMSTLVGGVSISISILVFVYSVLSISSEKSLNKKEKKEFSTLAECADEIEKMRKNSSTFKELLGELINQIESFKRKQESSHKILTEHFSDSGLSYDKFWGSIMSAEKAICGVIRGVIYKVNAFDEYEYQGLMNKSSYGSNSAIHAERMKLFKSYIDFVKKAVLINEELLMKLDKLILELSGLGATDGEDGSATLAELDDLINQTKLYK